MDGVGFLERQRQRERDRDGEVSGKMELKTVGLDLLIKSLQTRVSKVQIKDLLIPPKAKNNTSIAANRDAPNIRPPKNIRPKCVKNAFSVFGRNVFLAEKNHRIVGAGGGDVCV